MKLARFKMEDKSLMRVRIGISISEMNEDDEFDDIELTAAALSSIAGGEGERVGNS